MSRSSPLKRSRRPAAQSAFFHCFGIEPLHQLVFDQMRLCASLQSDDAYRFPLEILVVDDFLDLVDNCRRLGSIEDTCSLSFTRALRDESGCHRRKPVGRRLAQRDERRVPVAEIVAEADDFGYAPKVLAQRNRVLERTHPMPEWRRVPPSYSRFFAEGDGVPGRAPRQPRRRRPGATMHGRSTCHLRVRISSHSSPRSSAVSIRKGDLHSGRPDGTSPNQMTLSPSPYVLNRLRRSVAVALRKASRSVPFSSAARFIRSSAHQSCLTVRVAISHRRLLLFLRPMMETDRTRCTDPMTQGRAEVSVP